LLQENKPAQTKKGYPSNYNTEKEVQGLLVITHFWYSKNQNAALPSTLPVVLEGTGSTFIFKTYLYF
jgi:hypothetical protein